MAFVLAVLLTTQPMSATARRRHSASRASASASKQAAAASEKAGAAHGSRAAAKIARIQAVSATKAAPAKGSASRAHERIHEAVQSRRYRRARRPEPLQPAQLMPVHMTIPPPLFGSHESLVHQNVMAEAEGLERIQNDSDLDDRIAHGSLVQLPESPGLRVNRDLPENRRYARPWAAKFLSDLARAHTARFGSSPIEVTSAVRTVEYQRQLRTFNGNAAAADGDIASPHLTGGAIDIAKAGLTRAEIGWLRNYLIPLEQAGKIDVEEEFRQACFHISVYESYLGGAPPPLRLPEPAKPASLVAGSIFSVQGR